MCEEIFAGYCHSLLDSYFIHNTDDGREHIIHTIFCLGFWLDVDWVRLGPVFTGAELMSLC